MLVLAFHRDAVSGPERSLDVQTLRISGNALWDPLDLGVVSFLTRGAWRHADASYQLVTVSGTFRLLFGLRRKPSFMSEAISALTLAGSLLGANGVTFARYSETSELWEDTLRPMNWQSFSIVSEAVLSAYVDLPTMKIRNPWDPYPLPGERVMVTRQAEVPHIAG